MVGSIRQLLSQVYQGITASVGNLGVTEDTEHIRQVFDASFFIGQWLSGFSAICLYELLNPFIELSFGKQYLFGQNVVLVLCVNFYLNGMRNATLTFRDSMGLFYYDRYKAILEAVLNLLISVVLCMKFGVFGVFFGTTLSMLLTSIWIEPYILYRYGFYSSCKKYFVSFIFYCICAGAAGFSTDWISLRLLTGHIRPLVQSLLLRGCLCLVLPNLIFLICYFHRKEFRFIMDTGKKLLPGKRSQI